MNFKHLSFACLLFLVQIRSSEASELKVSHYLWSTVDIREHLLIEVKGSNKAKAPYERVTLTYSSKTSPTLTQRELSYNEQDNSWRVDLGQFQNTETVQISVSALQPRKNPSKRYTQLRKGSLRIVIADEMKKSSPTDEIQFSSFFTRVCTVFSFFSDEITKYKNLDHQITSASKCTARDLKKDADVCRFLAEHKVYVSLTTSPKRIVHLAKVLKTLDLNLIEEILVAIPERFGRDGSEYSIPEDLRIFPKVRILNIGKDLGPISKLLPAIEYVRAKDPGSVVITMDDDIGYPRGMVGELLRGIVKQDHTVVGGNGQNLSFWGISNFAIPKMRPHSGPGNSVELLEGFAGIAYVAKDVDVELMRYFTQKDRFAECFVSDDLVINFVLGLSHIDRHQLQTWYHNLIKLRVLQFGIEADALHMGGGLSTPTTPNLISLNAVKYQKCYQKLIGASFDLKTMSLKSREMILAN